MRRELHKYENLLNWNFPADRPNSKWVTDIFYSQNRVHLPAQARCSFRGKPNGQPLHLFLKPRAHPEKTGEVPLAQRLSD